MFKNSVVVMTLGSNYHPDLFVAGAVTFAKELAAAKFALEHAVTQRNLTHAIAEQAQVFAEEVVQNRVQAQEVLAATCCSRADTVDPVRIAFANVAIEVMEVTTLERVCVAANQGNIAFWAQARAEGARDDFYAATNALNSLCQCEAESDFGSTSKNDNKDDNEGKEFVGAQGVQGVRAQQKKKVKVDCGPRCSLRIMLSASV